MEKKPAKKKSQPKKSKADKKSAVNDIIQKIVDAHATIDQGLAEMSSMAYKHKDAEK